ncbi:MAG: DNA-processing protein DprA [Rhodomicrobium sp.]|jgi:DNA processing protein
MKAKSAKARRPQKEPSPAGSPPALEECEKRDRLRLIRTPHVGAVTFWQLLDHFGSASAAIEALPEFARYGSRVSPRSIPKLAAVEAELQRADDAGMSLLAPGEPGYPPLLAQIEAPPPLIYAKGDASVWDRPAVAVVGSRNASGLGLKFAGEIGADLGRRGFLIVSGLARGVDGAAHWAALPYGTCAVLAGGLDAIYPPEHVGLAGEIAATGVLIGECPPGFIARSQDFPRRNRIIAGACLGVVVVEAAERSGSLITARFAAEQNREVFAAPGHPLELRAAGSNRLIKEGAIFTTCAGDIEDALQALLKAWTRKPKEAGPPPRAKAAENAAALSLEGSSLPKNARTAAADGFAFLGEAIAGVRRLLSLSPIDVDELCRLSGLEAKHVNAALVSLDLSGQIERRGGRMVALKP